MTSSTSFSNAPCDPWDSLRQIIEELSTLVGKQAALREQAKALLELEKPITWSELPKTNEDLLPRFLRNGWHDSLRVLRNSRRGIGIAFRKIPRWVMQCTRIYKACVTEECL